MIQVEIDERSHPRAIIERIGDGADAGAWARLQEALSRGFIDGDRDQIVVQADVFLAELSVLREVKITYGVKFDLGPVLRKRLEAMIDDRHRREAAISNAILPTREEIQTSLANAGFIRSLKPFQIDNLRKIISLPHAADFSVPGAGKTSVSLACFALLRHQNETERLLVVAPLAAFASWKEDIGECFGDAPVVGVHLGPNEPLSSNVEILLTNYHRLASDYERLRSWVGGKSTHVVLDEAHRVKKGSSGVHGRAALDLAFAASRRDVLTGTPAPQGAHDLVALIRFLYPGQEGDILPQDVFSERSERAPGMLEQTRSAISHYFVRTCKSELELPPTTISVKRENMKPIQEAIYQALIGEYRGFFSMNDTDRWRLRRAGTIVMYLLEAATNPLLLGVGSHPNDSPIFSHPPIKVDANERLYELLERYAEYETPWKYDYVRCAVSSSAECGEKVLIWTNFVRHIQILESELVEWNPAIVHGGVPPQDGASQHAERTRESELDRFRNDPDCVVLLANPAACGEGINLHHWCHHAIYLDRTFNAGHFLQSQDRIHRLGLDEHTETKFTLLVSKGSIDEAVNNRVSEKVISLAKLMDDPDLVRVALPDEFFPDEENEALAEDYETNVFAKDDLSAIREHVREQD